MNEAGARARGRGGVRPSCPAAPALASIETPEAKAEASDAADDGPATTWKKCSAPSSRSRANISGARAASRASRAVVVSLSDQLAYLYRGDDLVAVAAISTGTDENPTPTGIFSVLVKKPMHRSMKYDNAPMPFMQMFDQYGTALHAGHNPGSSRQPRLRPAAGRVRQAALWRDRPRRDGDDRRIALKNSMSDGEDLSPSSPAF